MVECQICLKVFNSDKTKAHSFYCVRHLNFALAMRIYVDCTDIVKVRDRLAETKALLDGTEEELDEKEAEPEEKEAELEEKEEELEEKDGTIRELEEHLAEKKSKLEERERLRLKKRIG
ncbi:hypothetical protein M407DRAFT_221632 [Tulasnella calospora MUT 4182]|uniref:Uncharacterized protein n=1 Tax=Tulasnella calospora MUT 4182 TaxID=1051891 RepID=A0A0C3QSR8_9AGAM|nr:hypothetical protein M407DRAFT_221632 [Tulasnella calospora MUT 4182]